eukprot:2415424-Rhodomonas_salina.1
MSPELSPAELGSRAYCPGLRARVWGVKSRMSESRPGVWDPGHRPGSRIATQQRLTPHVAGHDQAANPREHSLVRPGPPPDKLVLQRVRRALWVRDSEGARDMHAIADRRRCA